MAGTLKVGTITTPSGSGTITIPSGVTLGNINNTPNFHAGQSSQSLPNASGVAIIYPTKNWDTGSLYNTSTGRFTVTSSTTGYYYLYASVGFANAIASRVQVRIYYNSTQWLVNEVQFDASGYPTAIVSAVVPLLNSGDYAYVQAYQNSGSSVSLSNEQDKNYFGGYKLIG